MFYATHYFMFQLLLLLISLCFCCKQYSFTLLWVNNGELLDKYINNTCYDHISLLSFCFFPSYSNVVESIFTRLEDGCKLGGNFKDDIFVKSIGDNHPPELIITTMSELDLEGNYSKFLTTWELKGHSKII